MNVHDLGEAKQALLVTLVGRRADLVEAGAEVDVQLRQVDAAIRALTPELGTYQAGDMRVVRQVNRTFDRVQALAWTVEHHPDALPRVATPAWTIDRVRFAEEFPDAAQDCWRHGDPKLVIK